MYAPYSAASVGYVRNVTWTMCGAGAEQVTICSPRRRGGTRLALHCRDEVPGHRAAVGVREHRGERDRPAGSVTRLLFRAVVRARGHGHSRAGAHPRACAHRGLRAHRRLSGHRGLPLPAGVALVDGLVVTEGFALIAGLACQAGGGRLAAVAAAPPRRRRPGSASRRPWFPRQGQARRGPAATRAGAPTVTRTESRIEAGTSGRDRAASRACSRRGTGQRTASGGGQRTARRCLHGAVRSRRACRFVGDLCRVAGRHGAGSRGLASTGPCGGAG